MPMSVNAMTTHIPQIATAEAISVATVLPQLLGGLSFDRAAGRPSLFSWTQCFRIIRVLSRFYKLAAVAGLALKEPRVAIQAAIRTKGRHRGQRLFQ